MHKRALLLLTSILLLHSVYALDTTINPSYAQGETMLVEITGSIRSSLQPSQVEFLRGHVQVGSFEYDLKRLGNRYFLYAIAPFASNNYTLVIHNVETFVNGQATTLDIVENFTITNETAPYTIRPGFMISAEDSSIIVTSHEDVPQEIVFMSEENNSVTLQPGQNTLRFDIEPFGYGLHFINVGGYEFPLYSLHQSSPSDPPMQPRIIELSPLRIEERFVRTNQPRVLTFIITNTADRELEDFTFEYDDERYELKPARLRSLEANQSVTFNLTLLKEEDVSDSFIITVDDESIELPLEVRFVEESFNETTPLNITPGSENRYHCEELNGRICLAAQQCSGESVSSLEGSCCRGTCVQVEQTQSLAWLGYLIGVVVVFIILIVLGRYLKARSRAKGENPLENRMKKLEKPF